LNFFSWRGIHKRLTAIPLYF